MHLHAPSPPVRAGLLPLATLSRAPAPELCAAQILMAFAWVGGFSFLLSTIISRWSILLGAPTIILGITMIALGGEIPDCIQSVSVARRGYGSLAVANCVGSKVVNVGIGLGLPWLLSALAFNQPVIICGHDELFTASLFSGGAIVILFVITLCHAWATRQNKAVLGKGKGWFLLACYFLLMASYCLYFFLAPREP